MEEGGIGISVSCCAAVTPGAGEPQPKAMAGSGKGRIRTVGREQIPGWMCRRCVRAAPFLLPPPGSTSSGSWCRVQLALTPRLKAQASAPRGRLTPEERSETAGETRHSTSKEGAEAKPSCGEPCADPEYLPQRKILPDSVSVKILFWHNYPRKIQPFLQGG